MRSTTGDRQVLFWLSAAIVLILAVMLLRDVLLPFVAGIVIAYFLNPIADRLTRLGLGRLVASVIIVVGVGVILVLALVFLVPLLVDQTQQLLVALPEQLRKVAGLIEAWGHERFGDRFPRVDDGMNRALDEVSRNWTQWAGPIFRSLWDQSRALVNLLSLLLITPLVVFYLLVDWHPMLTMVNGWLPRDHATTLRRLAGEIDDAVAAFIRGQGTVCLVLGAFYAAALSVVGLRYGLVVGLATGLLAFVPFVGWALGLIIATALALAQFGAAPVPVLTVVGVFLAGQALDAGFLSPKIVGSRIGLHPVWLIFALFVFSYLFGFVGVLVAVPVAAAIAVLVRFALSLYLASSVYQGSNVPPADRPAAKIAGTGDRSGRQ